MFAWSQLDVSAIPVSISAVFNRQTNLTKCNQEEKIAKNSKGTGREKTSEKRDLKLVLSLFLLFLGRSFQQLNFE
jgi:hypothetical protein